MLTLNSGVVFDDQSIVLEGNNTFKQCKVPADATDIARVAMGNKNTVFLKRIGKVGMFGNTTGYTSYFSWENVVQVCNAGDFILGVTADGKLLHDGPSKTLWKTIQDKDWSDIKQVEAMVGSPNIVLAVTKSGQILSTWNQDMFNSVGTTVATAKKIVMSSNHIAILHTDGTVTVVIIGFDYDQNGVRSWNSIIDIFSTDSYIFGLKSDGTVVQVGTSGGKVAINTSLLKNIKFIGTGLYHIYAITTTDDIIFLGDAGNSSNVDKIISANKDTETGYKKSQSIISYLNDTTPITVMRESYLLTINLNTPSLGSVTLGTTEITEDSVNALPNGDMVSVTAVPKEDVSRFLSWTTSENLVLSDDTNPAQELKMIDDYILTANFIGTESYKKLEVEVDVNEETGESLGTVMCGSFNITNNKRFYNDLTLIKLEAYPADGMVFMRWSGDIATTDNPFSFYLIKNYKVKAIFEPKKYGIYVNVIGEGSTNYGIGTIGYFEHGSSITIKAEPNDNNTFSMWSVSGYIGDYDAFMDELTLDPIESDITITVTFTKEKRFIEINYQSEVNGNNQGGGITLSPIGIKTSNFPLTYAYDYGVEISALAWPDELHSFLKWSDDVELNPRPIVMNKNQSITAIFRKQQQTLTLKIDGMGQLFHRNISDSSSTEIYGEGTYSYYRGTKLEVGVILPSGVVLEKWTGNFINGVEYKSPSFRIYEPGHSNYSSADGGIDKDIEMTAHLKAVTTSVSITKNAIEDVKYDPCDNSDTPDIVGLRLADGSGNITPRYPIEVVKNDFSEEQLYGLGSKENSYPKFVTIDVEPDEGSEFGGFKLYKTENVDLDSLSARSRELFDKGYVTFEAGILLNVMEVSKKLSYRILLMNQQVVNADFVKKVFTLMYSLNGSGTITAINSKNVETTLSPGTEYSYKYGDKLKLVATPNPNYTFSKWVIIEGEYIYPKQVDQQWLDYPTEEGYYIYYNYHRNELYTPPDYSIPVGNEYTVDEYGHNRSCMIYGVARVTNKPYVVNDIQVDNFYVEGPNPDPKVTAPAEVEIQKDLKDTKWFGPLNSRDTNSLTSMEIDLIVKCNYRMYANFTDISYMLTLTMSGDGGGNVWWAKLGNVVGFHTRYFSSLASVTTRRMKLCALPSPSSEFVKITGDINDVTPAGNWYMGIDSIPGVGTYAVYTRDYRGLNVDEDRKIITVATASESPYPYALTSNTRSLDYSDYSENKLWYGPLTEYEIDVNSDKVVDFEFRPVYVKVTINKIGACDDDFVYVDKKVSSTVEYDFIRNTHITLAVSIGKFTNFQGWKVTYAGDEPVVYDNSYSSIELLPFKDVVVDVMFDTENKNLHLWALPPNRRDVASPFVMGDNLFDKGTYLVLMAEPESHYRKYGWYESGKRLYKVNFRLMDDRDVMVRFIKMVQIVTVDVIGGEAEVSPSAGYHIFLSGTVLTFSANIISGTFVRWKVNGKIYTTRTVRNVTVDRLLEVVLELA